MKDLGIAAPVEMQGLGVEMVEEGLMEVQGEMLAVMAEEDLTEERLVRRKAAGSVWEYVNGQAPLLLMKLACLSAAVSHRARLLQVRTAPMV
jgi:hypothetical protein